MNIVHARSRQGHRDRRDLRDLRGRGENADVRDLRAFGGNKAYVVLPAPGGLPVSQVRVVRRVSAEMSVPKATPVVSDRKVSRETRGLLVLRETADPLGRKEIPAPQGLPVPKESREI